MHAHMCVCIYIHMHINIYTSQITILANCMSSEFVYMMLHLWLNCAYTDDMKPQFFHVIFLCHCF